MKAQWAISTETVTPESAEDGEAASTDYMDGLTFREAFDAFTDADCEAGGREANCSPLSRDYPPDWFTAYGSMDYRTGETVNTSLHVPRHVTPASRLRIARLLRVHGA